VFRVVQCVGKIRLDDGYPIDSPPDSVYQVAAADLKKKVEVKVQDAVEFMAATEVATGHARALQVTVRPKRGVVAKVLANGAHIVALPDAVRWLQVSTSRSLRGFA
jgi:hypothetical protein